MKAEEKDRLKSLFQEIKLEESSAGFENRLMQQIYIVEKKRRQKEKLNSILAITCGIIGIFGIPALILYLRGIYMGKEIQLSEYKLEVSFPEIHFDPFIVSIGAISLFLLIADTLIRKRIWEKKQKE